MGCTTSSRISGGSKEDPRSGVRRSRTEERIRETLAKQKKEIDKAGNALSFEKILLRFEKLQIVLAKIKKVYDDSSKGASGLSISGLQEALKELHTDLGKEDIIDIFEFVDLDDSKVIELKEFLVALTVAYTLDIVRVRSESEKSYGEAITADHIGSQHIKSVCNLIVCAYLLFDPQAKGYITKNSVRSLIEEGKKGGKGNNNAMLSEQRWGEMDWDANGQIDFPEFVHAFSSWVDIEGDLE